MTIFFNQVQAQIVSATNVVIKGVHVPEPLPKGSPLRAWSKGISHWSMEIAPPPPNGEWLHHSKRIEYFPRAFCTLMPEPPPNGCAFV